jgi:hypothetical protein
VRALGDILFGVTVFLVLSLVVPRVNGRLKGSRTGWDQLFESTTGRAYMLIVGAVLVAAIVVTAMGN